jgi:hypothetical protein
MRDEIARLISKFNLVMVKIEQLRLEFGGSLSDG